MQPIKIFIGPKGEELARDFTFIDDVVKGCVASLDSAQPSTGSGGKKKKKAQFRVFNLGNTSPVTVGHFVSILEKHLGKKAIRKYVKDPRHLVAAYQIACHALVFGAGSTAAVLQAICALS